MEILKSYIAGRRLVLLIAQILVAIIFVIVNWNLAVPPTKFAYTNLQIGLLIVYGVVTLLAFYFNWQELGEKLLGISRLIAMILFTIALLLVVRAGNPNSKPLEQAQDLTLTKTDAAVTGVKLGEAVQLQQLTAAEAEQQIDQQYGVDATARQIALNSLMLKVNSGQADEQIIAATSPTVPLEINKWSCNDVGCGYTDGGDTWTISSNNLVFSRFLQVVMFLSLILTVNNIEVSKLRKLLIP